MHQPAVGDLLRLDEVGAEPVELVGVPAHIDAFDAQFGAWPLGEVGNAERGDDDDHNGDNDGIGKKVFLEIRPFFSHRQLM